MPKGFSLGCLWALSLQETQMRESLPSHLYWFILNETKSMLTRDVGGLSRYIAGLNIAEVLCRYIAKEHPDSLIGVIGSPEIPIQPIAPNFWKLLFSARAHTFETKNFIEAFEFIDNVAILNWDVPIRTVIIISDGQNVLDPRTVEAANRVKDLDFQIAVIGIAGKRSDVNEDALMQVASLVSGKPKYWFADPGNSAAVCMKEFSIWEV